MVRLLCLCTGVHTVWVLAAGAADGASPNIPVSATIRVSAFVPDPIGLLRIRDSGEEPSVLGLRLPEAGKFVALSSSGASASFSFDTERVVSLASLPCVGDTITVICTEN